MSTPLLFHPIRECVCCGRTAPIRARRTAGTPAIMGVNFGIYRAALHVKNQHKAAASVGICEDCFAVVMASDRRFWQRAEVAKFLAAIRQSLSRCYNELLLKDCNVA